VSFDDNCALQLGKTRGGLLRHGIIVSPVDLMIGTIALVHNLTLVTHNTPDFRNIPGLRLDDWLAP
jgi:tRNA(fMet)-specific endonuclease VapC